MANTILTLEQRIVIETLRKENRSYQYIADFIGFSKTTIFNEVHRIKGTYHAKKAHEDYLEKVSHRGRKSILTSDIKDDIESKIKDSHWAPETVAAMSKSKFCFKSIYNWIDNNLLDIQLENLPDKGIRRRRAAETRGKATQQGKSIEDRHEEVNKRLVFGHFEGDTVLSGKTKGQALGTFLERISRFYIVTRLSDRNSAAMTEAILNLAEKLGTKGMKSITVDHGKEFSGYKQVEEQSNVDVYFAHAYAPHERGANENRNRALRRFIPKGRPIEEVSDEELMRINWTMNTMPLKCLNWRTPLEVFMEHYRS